MRSTRLLRAVSMLILATGCASGRRPVGPAPLGRAVITEDELAANEGISVFDLIQRIRPEFLRARSAQSQRGGMAITAPPPAVLVNGQVTGAVADLRQIPVSALALVRHYGIEEAKRTFGMQYEGGVIELTYRDQTRPFGVP